MTDTLLCMGNAQKRQIHRNKVDLRFPEATGREDRAVRTGEGLLMSMGFFFWGHKYVLKLDHGDDYTTS